MTKNTDTPNRVLDIINEAKLKNFVKLDLSFQRLSYFPFEIFELHQLEILNLNNNRIRTIPYNIDFLNKLTHLSLSGNNLELLPKSIANLNNLTHLDLSFNFLNKSIKNFEYIGELDNLKQLDLSSNDLYKCELAFTYIFRTKNLAFLYLNSNKLNATPDIFKNIKRLSSLTSLDLSDNKLGDTPKIFEYIAQIQTLRFLGLHNNELYKSILKIFEYIKQLPNLKQLILRENELGFLPYTIGEFRELNKLDLCNNHLKELPESIENINTLMFLYLDNNNLNKISKSIVELPKLLELSVEKNSVVDPPPEIVFKGINALRNYFQQIEEEGIDHLYEAKLLIVGEGGAGKTTLCNKIIDPDYHLKPEEESTKGIDIYQKVFELHLKRNFQINIWDFGGQEIYHATHQFFLTKRSLYALVADSRREDTDFKYWLNLVELLSHNSPVIIVQNEKQDRFIDIDRSGIRERFSNVKEFLRTNLATNRGLDEVIKCVELHVQSLPHIGDKLPKTWIKIREVLENSDQNYISQHKYFDICRKNGINSTVRAQTLSEYLHDLGVILHFQDDPILANTIILNNTWGTDAVYKVLDNSKVQDNNGNFTYQDLFKIWDDPIYANKQSELLQLMIKFKLCYKIVGKEQMYITPQLLPQEKPVYAWNNLKNLEIKYKYRFMPKGIITRFIVEMHRHIKYQTYVWKRGVLLEKENTRAEVIETYGTNEIKIRIEGKAPVHFKNEITKVIDKINNSYGDKLVVRKLIPCICPSCIKSNEPHFFDEEKLLNRRKDGMLYIECDVRPNYHKVSIQDLLSDFIHKESSFSENIDI